MNVEEMADLFDVEVGPNLDREVPEAEISSLQSKISDMRAMTESEPEPAPRNPEPPTEPKKMDETKLVRDVVQGEMKSKAEKTSGEGNSEGLAPAKTLTTKAEVPDIPEELVAVVPPSEPPEKINGDNPLDLTGMDLKAFQMMKEKCPKFRLFDGSQAFKTFYQYKVRVLKEVLTRFAVLDIADMRHEIRDTDTDLSVKESIASPDLIRERLDAAYRNRIRLVTLLSQAYEQFPAWKRILEMLRGKLWKDHEGSVRTGAHKRDGLTLEHLVDVELYVKELEGFIDAGKMIDELLKAAAESLSRQLSCLQLKEPTGFGSHGVKSTYAPPEKPKQVGPLDELDSVKDGEVIDNDAAKQSNDHETTSWSHIDATDDELLSQIG